MTKAGFLALALVCSCCNLTQAQPWPQVVRYDADAGLPQNSVWALHTDALGRLWYGCSGSVGYWDGYQNEQQTRRGAFIPLRRNSNRFNFFSDRQGRFWISHDTGVLFYEPNRGRFTETMAGSGQAVIIGELGSGLLVRTEKRGLLWLLKLPTGEYLSEPAGKSPLPLPESFVPGKSARVGKLYLIPYSGRQLLVFDTATSQCSILSARVDISGIFGLGKDTAVCFQGDSVWLFTLRNRQLQIQKKPYAAKTAMQVTDLISYRGHWLAGGPFGLCLLNRANLQADRFIPSPDIHEKETVFVYCLHQDPGGNLYIGTNTHGLYQISPYRHRFDLSETRGIVKCISSLPDGRILAGRYGSPELEISSRDETVFIPLVAAQVQRAPNSIWGIHAVREDAVWVVDETSVGCFNMKTGEWRLRKNITSGPALHYPVFREHQGGLFVNLAGNAGSGIYRISETGRFDTLLFLKGEEITSYSIENGRAGLVGTRKALYRILPDQRKSQLHKGWIKSIHQSRNGTFYIATTLGVFTLQPVHPEKLSPLKQLPDPFVYGILEDRQGRIWFSTNSGLYRFNPSSGLWTGFNKADGLPANEFNTGAYHCDHAGNLHFGSVKGWCRIPASHFPENVNKPAVWLNEILVNEKPYVSDTLPQFLHGLTLPYHRNNLAFGLRAIDLGITEKNRLRYKLEGQDAEWIDCDAIAMLRYARLQPGQYRLMVQAIGSDGHIGNAFILPVHILPPFWRTWWFHLLEGIIATTLLWLGIRWYAQRQRQGLETELRILRQVEAERLRISRDLHDHAGSQLSMLLASIEQLRKRPSGLPQNALSRLEENGREAMQTLRESIWAMSHEQISYTAFADRFKNFSRRMVQSHEGPELHFSEAIDNDVLLPAEQSLQLFRLCQEAFHNACKHSKASHIHISFEEKESLVCVRIEDNGCGLPADLALRNDAYGLRNMETRAQEYGISILIDATEGSGTLIEFQLSWA